MSDTYITLLIPTSIIPSWDPGQDDAENEAKARIREGCGWLKTNTLRLVVVIDPKDWLAYGVNPDGAIAILFIVQVADVGSFLISLINGDITKIKQPNGSDLQPYSLEIGGNKPPPPVPKSKVDDAVKLAGAIGSDSALAAIADAEPPPVTLESANEATEGDNEPREGD